jgi:PilZ domain
MWPAVTGARYPQRSGLRYAFAASVKVEDPNSGKQIISVTSNLSRTGCHIRTSTPFRRGTKITIKHQGITFRCDGEVVYAIPGVGMGIRFDNETAEHEALNGWLVQISNNVVEHRPESTDTAASSKQKIVLVVFIVALTATAAGLLAWLVVLR